MAAWGQLQNCDKSISAELKILSYELGVLFFNDKTSPAGALAPVAPERAPTSGERACPVPYPLPSRPFGHYEEPWSTDGRCLEPVRRKCLFFSSMYVNVWLM